MVHPRNADYNFVMSGPFVKAAPVAIAIVATTSADARVRHKHEQQHEATPLPLGAVSPLKAAAPVVRRRGY